MNLEINENKITIHLANDKMVGIVLDGNDLLVYNIPANDGGKPIEIHDTGSINTIRLRFT